jgi:serine/threonine-protein kinase RsbW
MLLELTIPSDLSGARHVQDFVEEALRVSPFLEHDIFSIKLGVEEALVDAIKYGNQMDPDKRLFVALHVTSERFEIRITDEGSGSTRTVSRPFPAA